MIWDTYVRRVHNEDRPKTDLLVRDSFDLDIVERREPTDKSDFGPEGGSKKRKKKKKRGKKKREEKKKRREEAKSGLGKSRLVASAIHSCILDRDCGTSYGIGSFAAKSISPTVRRTISSR